MLLLGRRARERLAEYGKKPETFEFVGFMHLCGTDKNCKTALVRIPSKKSCRKFLDRTHEWLKRHTHWKRRDQQRHLASMLRGFYHHFALHHCMSKLYWMFGEVDGSCEGRCGGAVSAIACSGATSRVEQPIDAISARDLTGTGRPRHVLQLSCA